MNPHAHDPEDCPKTRCRYCGPDAQMWLIGGIIAAPFTALVWLARNYPPAAVALAVVYLTAATAIVLLVL